MLSNGFYRGMKVSDRLSRRASRLSFLAGAAKGKWKDVEKGWLSESPEKSAINAIRL
jgi:hypothetical protein